ncbi:MAG TPA: FTR1 family protein [Vicinamibacterales bacterium]
MVQAFVITLREGLEALLIVAISLAYLRKTDRRALIPAVHWGIAASIALSNQSLWEGILGICAAFLVASLTVHMWRAGRHMKREIEGRLEARSERTGAAAFWGVSLPDVYARGAAARLAAVVESRCAAPAVAGGVMARGRCRDAAVAARGNEKR